MLPAREQTPALLQLCCSMCFSSSRLLLQATNASTQPLSLPSRSENCKRREEKAGLPDKQQRPRWRNLPFFALKKYLTYRTKTGGYGKVIVYTLCKLFKRPNGLS
uniref:Putative secreted protein n=1 Tax=Ixodes ricinus TaxID=34613 RepID=A0A6B0UIK5_IXORI